MSSRFARYTGRARMPKFVDIKLIPFTLWVIIATTWVIVQGTASVWGWSRGIAVGLVYLIACYAPRQARVNWFTSALYYLVDPVIEADRWEGYRGDRWRSRLQKFGFERDFTFWGNRSTAARKSKYVRLKLVPAFSLWPKPWHVQAAAIKIPPRKQVNAILDKLTEAVAEFFDVPPTRLKVDVQRAWMRTVVTFTVLKANGGNGRPRDYIEVLDRGR